MDSLSKLTHLQVGHFKGHVIFTMKDLSFGSFTCFQTKFLYNFLSQPQMNLNSRSNFLDRAPLNLNG
jgi:hypothetical protein